MGTRFGRYETIREIAAGGMATVHLGRVSGEGGFERLVAIKVMHKHLARDDEFVTMFLDEARLAARIRHPNVVATLDVQKSAEGMFLVMDYIEGASLHEMRRYLKKNNELLPLGVALRTMLDALTGLHDAHELVDDDGQLLDLVHRDVSPQNILVGKDGVARLTDFGVARASARLSSTRGGQLKGKLSYMPPEQIMAETVDRRSDVYSAGVVLWEVLVGKRLFRAKSDGELVHKILSGAPEAPHEKTDRVPEVISRACMRALSLYREERYPTAAVFADEIEDAARQAGVPVASSRAVGTFMKSMLPAMESARASSDGSLTPPSGLSQVSKPKEIRLPMDSASSAVTSVPGFRPGDSSTRTAAVVNSPPRSRFRARAAVAGVGLVVVAATIGALSVIGTADESAPRDPSLAIAGDDDSSVPATSEAPSSSTAATEDDSTAQSAAPSVSVAPSAVPTAEPTPRRPTGIGRSRPKPTPNPSLTDYDPDEL